MTAKVGDIGTEIIVEFTTKDCANLDAVLNISDQTTLDICIRKPDMTTILVKPGVFTAAPCGLGDGTDGKASYFTEDATIFDQVGIYCVEGKVVKPAGTWRTDPFTFEVIQPFCP